MVSFVKPSGYTGESLSLAEEGTTPLELCAAFSKCENEVMSNQTGKIANMGVGPLLPGFTCGNPSPNRKDGTATVSHTNEGEVEERGEDPRTGHLSLPRVLLHASYKEEHWSDDTVIPSPERGQRLRRSIAKPTGYWWDRASGRVVNKSTETQFTHESGSTTKGGPAHRNLDIEASQPRQPSSRRRRRLSRSVSKPAGYWRIHANGGGETACFPKRDRRGGASTPGVASASNDLAAKEDGNEPKTSEGGVIDDTSDSSDEEDGTVGTVCPSKSNRGQNKNEDNPMQDIGGTSGSSSKSSDEVEQNIVVWGNDRTGKVEARLGHNRSTCSGSDTGPGTIPVQALDAKEAHGQNSSGDGRWKRRKKNAPVDDVSMMQFLSRVDRLDIAYHGEVLDTDALARVEHRRLEFIQGKTAEYKAKIELFAMMKTSGAMTHEVAEKGTEFMQNLAKDMLFVLRM